MFSLIYISRESDQFTAARLLELLEQSRDRNKKLDITGLLLYRGGNFMQILEGRRDVVLDLHGSICRDRRHFRVVTVLQEGIKARKFPDWTMAFRDLEASKDELPVGYSDFLRDPWESLQGSAFPESVGAFLKMFVLSTKGD